MSRSAGNRWRVTANSNATVISATPSALRPGVFSTGMPCCGRRRDVHVRRVASRRADDPQRPLEHLALHEVGLADQNRRTQLVDPLGEFGAIPDAHRRVVEPRIELDVAHLSQLLEPRTTETRRDSATGRSWARFA